MSISDKILILNEMIFNTPQSIFFYPKKSLKTSIYKQMYRIICGCFALNSSNNISVYFIYIYIYIYIHTVDTQNIYNKKIMLDSQVSPTYLSSLMQPCIYLDIYLSISIYIIVKLIIFFSMAILPLYGK